VTPIDMQGEKEKKKKKKKVTMRNASQSTRKEKPWNIFL